MFNKKNLLYADTTIVDTTELSKKFDVDAVVTAIASDSLIFNIAEKKMFVYGSGQLNYKDTELKSGKIFIDYNTNELEAYGIEISSDTAEAQIKQTPVLKEGAEVYEGAWLRYNFKNQKGFISAAKNAAQGSRYEGEKVKKVDKNTYFIEDGMFTTCEEDTPHTYFTASEMKVIQRDKIVARWIFMHVGGVPFPVPLPFAVFPNESGRRSGLIIPTYGNENRRGQYFRNFGYFWAMSDYMDVALTGDYYTRGGFGLRSRFRYVDRYNFSGNINGGFSKFSYGDKDLTEQSDWNIEWFHNQQINPTSRLDANLRFQSSNFYTNNSISYNDLLTQDIYSSANYSKIWDEAGASMNISYNRTQNLESGNITESLPSINFSKNTFYPFKSALSRSLQNQNWYEMLALSYSGQFRNERRKFGGDLKVRGGVNHSLNMNVSPKIGYFNISPRISYQEKWYNKRIKQENLIIEKIDTTGRTYYEDSLVVSDVKEINFIRSFDFSVSASTKLYGMMQPNILGIESFRHTLTPSISYVYKPDFSSDKWGYYDSYTKANGEVVRYDKFGSEIFGGAGSGESQSLNFSLGNVFEIKTSNTNDTTGRSEPKKIQLLNLTASVGYNFAAEEFKLSNLNLSYRTQIGQFLDLSGSSSYTFYDFDGNRRLNKYLVSLGKGLFRLTNFSFSVSTSLSGEKLKSDKSRDQEKEDEPSAFKKTDYISLYDDSESPDLSIPWDLNLSYNYNLSKPFPSNVTKYSSMAANLSFSLTKNWKFSVRGSYDFDQKQVIAPQVSIYRDLHCWEMNFSWYPIGIYRGFHFEIRMKAPELQDIKITKSRGLYSGRR